MACQHSPDDQTLRFQAGAGEDKFTHLPNGHDYVTCKRQKVEKEVSQDPLILVKCISGAPLKTLHVSFSVLMHRRCRDPLNGDSGLAAKLRSKLLSIELVL